MLFRKRRKFSLLRFIWRLFLLGFIALIAAPFAPLEWLNPVLKHLPHSVQLIQPTGKLYNAGWSAIEIDKKRYTVACRYRPQAFNASGLSYQLNCDSPLTTSATVAVNFSGELIVKNTHIAGEINQIAPWVAPQMPTLNGLVDLTIKRTVMSNRALTYLDISGKIPYICLFTQPEANASAPNAQDCLNHITIQTTQKQLTSTQPIRIDTKNDASQDIQLNIQTDVDGENYLSDVELSGEPLRAYARILRTFAREERLNTFIVLLKGRFAWAPPQSLPSQ